MALNGRLSHLGRLGRLNSNLLKKILVTGSSGLMGSEVCEFFSRHGFAVHEVDNNQRAVFFGPQGDTCWNRERLAATLPGFLRNELHIRDRLGVLALIKEVKPGLIVHATAQQSHDRAAAIQFPKCRCSFPASPSAGERERTADQPQ
jgi:CDP-paratose 2-epimerase